MLVSSQPAFQWRTRQPHRSGEQSAPVLDMPCASSLFTGYSLEKALFVFAWKSTPCFDFGTYINKLTLDMCQCRRADEPDYVSFTEWFGSKGQGTQIPSHRNFLFSSSSQVKANILLLCQQAN